MIDALLHNELGGGHDGRLWPCSTLKCASYAHLFAPNINCGNLVTNDTSAVGVLAASMVETHRRRPL